MSRDQAFDQLVAAGFDMTDAAYFARGAADMSRQLADQKKCPYDLALVAFCAGAWKIHNGEDPMKVRLAIDEELDRCQDQS